MPVKSAADYDPVERRIRAAMMLAGVDFKHLAARIGGVRNLSESTLRRLNDTEPKATRIHLRAIAEACGVPYEFFTTPIDQLGRPSTDGQAEPKPPIAEINEVAELREELRQLMARVSELQWDVTDLASQVRQQDAQSETPKRGRAPRERT